MQNFINKKNYLRNLSDEQFENDLPDLANYLSSVTFEYSYTNDELLNDWNSLCLYSPDDPLNTSSGTRHGMKLCEHFFPNFFDIKNNKNQKFSDYWNPIHLQKVLRWNRKSHSTPYLSELRRGVFFCFGLTKNTMYRPHLSKCVSLYHKNFFEKTVVLDPCCGWGGRMLGTVSAGNYYIGFEPNKQTYENLNKLANFLGIQKHIQIYNDVAENIQNYDFDNVDIILTSPPYFDLEIYSDEKTQSCMGYTTYNDWSYGWLRNVIHNCCERLNTGGVSCWNVHNVGKMNMIQDVENYHTEINKKYSHEFKLSSSARQSNQNKTKSKKNNDITKCFS